MSNNNSISIAINHTLCKKDGICTSVCPAGIFVQSGKLALLGLSGVERCISCGQCLAVCPQNAIVHSDFSADKIVPIDFANLPDTLQLMELLRARRSIRSFRNQPVAKEQLEKIVEGARFAPSGHNSQSTEFLVITDKNLLGRVTKLTIDYLRFEVHRFGNPLFRQMIRLISPSLADSAIREIQGFQRLIHSFVDGQDLILYNAPTLLVFHAPRYAGFADVNANLALQNASLVAHTLNVGSFYTGFLVSAYRAPLAPQWGNRLSTLIGLPPGNKVYAALAMGYPIPKFKNWIDRNPSRIIWRT